MPVPPPHPGELTPDWLTELLREGGALGAARVASLELESMGRFTGELWRLRLTYDRAAPAAPGHLVLKRPAAGRPDRVGEGFALEGSVYRELSATLPVGIPRCYFAGDEKSGRRALLLLEDLEVVPFDWLSGAGLEHAQLALAGLAQLHAFWWERVAALDWVPSLADPALTFGFEAAYRRGWQTARPRILATFGAPLIGLGDALLGRVAESTAALAAPATLLHGDAHGENIPLQQRQGRAGRRRVVFLDWAGPRRGHPAFDVAFFLVMSLSVEARRRREAELLAHYLDAARAAGMAPWPDPWGAYRRGILRRFTRIIELAAEMGGSGDGLDPAFRMVLERCAGAALDHDVASLVA